MLSKGQLINSICKSVSRMGVIAVFGQTLCKTNLFENRQWAVPLDGDRKSTLVRAYF